MPDPQPEQLPQLRQEPLFIGHFYFTGFWRRPAVCGLEIIPIPDGRVVVIATELKDNPGTSITNCAATLATLVCRRFSIRPDRLVWIEHYGYSRAGEERGYDLVSFDHISPLPAPSPSSRCLGAVAFRGDAGQESCFHGTHWRPIKEQDWAALGLPPRPAVRYT